MRNITFAGSGIEPVAGIEINSTAAAGNTISKSAVRNLTCTNTGVFNVTARGISAEAAATIQKCFVTDIQNQATGTATFISGIFTQAGNLYNNVVLLDNTSSINSVEGISIDGAGNVNAYHNTVKITGTATGASHSAALFVNSTASQDALNNIFQNLRTGGTVGQYAIEIQATNIFTTNYNFLEVAKDQNQVCLLATDHTFASWKTATGANNSLNGATTLDATGKAPTTFVGANAGTNLSATVPDDKVDVSRSTTPWMGAYESGYATNTIATDAIAPASLCRGQIITINYTITGIFNAGNVFTAQLSDANGSFASPLNLGNVTSTTNISISDTIPAEQAMGTLYRIRVISSNPPVTGSDNGSNLTVLGNCTFYWVGGEGNWDDATHWSKSSGGAGGVGIPNIHIDVFIDDNSGTGSNAPVHLTGPAQYYTRGFTMMGVNGSKTPLVGRGSLMPRPNWAD